ncbi:hypothetical protein SEUCBS139899_002995 [Sporothrix eucalyptigena]|uniref:Alpha/beta hydrolase fold-3 domain-containing protein n=1 Tax=Sporothrix eucalyptigena TaxID=1812306 RepID=A0ABP0C8W5_9PEZI
MSLPYDPEYFKILEPLLPVFAKRTPLTADNIVATRPVRNAGVAALINRLPDAEDLEETVYHAVAPDGFQVPVLALVKKSSSLPSSLGPAILHFHGGGMLMGTAAMYARQLRPLVSQTGIPLFSVDYRLAPEVSGTTLVEDGYAALQWLHSNATTFNIDPARIAVFGQSAGGGLAAGVALLARDRQISPPLAKQILVYPMLDDRTQTVNEAIEPKAFWKTADNVTAWTCVLGDKAGKPDAEVSPYAAPARATSLAALPSTYIDVGALDIFRDEDIAYATRLLADGVDVELHVYAGIPHAFEVIAPNISATKRADENRLNAFLSF